ELSEREPFGRAGDLAGAATNRNIFVRSSAPRSLAERGSAARTRSSTRARRALLPLAWTAGIWWVSTDSFGPARTGPILVPPLQSFRPWANPDQLQTLHWLVRKAAHAGEYGVLAAAWCWALGRDDAHRPWLIPLALSVVTAAFDELHQAMTQTRTASIA